MNVDYADVHDIIYTDINIETDEIIPKSLIQKNDEHKYENTDLNFMPVTICAQVVYHHEYSAGSEKRRGKNRNILFKNINVIGDKLPKVLLEGYDEEHKTENITISNLCLNGKPISTLPPENIEIKNHVENVKIEVDPYSQMSKNTVSAEGQLKESDCVRFKNPKGIGKRVMFVGNSITLHGIRPEVGWYNVWGMAASSKEKDYVHILESDITKLDKDAAFCVCQVADWECNYKNNPRDFSKYDEARKFSADIIVLRFIENVKKADYDADIFKREFMALAEYLNGTKKAKFIVTTGFWRHPADEDLKELAKALNAPCVDLSDLGDNDKMKAIGLFEHRGVANHPGDAGMKAISERLMNEIKVLI
jgi:hypothetical protein